MRKIKLLMLLILASTSYSIAQKHTETISRKMSFPSETGKNVVFVENINGSVEVEPSDNNTVLLEATLEITGDSEKIVAQGKQEVKLISEVVKDTILIYIDCPAINHHSHDSRRRYNYNSRRIEYDFKVDIKLKVPKNVLADVSTVNDGNVIVNNLDGSVKASNVNGNVSINGANEILNASTVNGEIRVTSNNPPSQDAEFRTINGDVYLNYPKSISANLKFKSFNGEFYTDYEITKYLPTEVKKSSKNDKGTTYKLEGFTVVQIGEGGPEIKLETLNGDVYVASKKL